MALDPDIEAAFSDSPSPSESAPLPSSKSSIDPEISAAFGGDGQSAAGPHAHRDLHQTTWRQALGWTSHGTPSQPEVGDQSQAEIGAGRMATSGNFWRGIGRGMLGTYFGSENNRANVREGPNGTVEHIPGPTPGEQEARGIAQRLSMTGGEDTPEGQAGQVVGGIFGPSPFNAMPAGAPERAAVDSPQSISAAAASPVQTGSPELQAAAKEVTDSGGKVNQEVLGRHLEAESLPVPARLTKGQATQDPALVSLERNTRGKNQAFSDHFNAQNQNLIDNLQAIRENVGPDVFSTNPVDHGEALINAYKTKAQQADADIASKYQALRDANGGQFPIDAKGLYSNVTKSLHDKYLFEHAPSAEMRQLSNASDEGMTFEKYEAMRTNLARIMRSSTDGNERAAAGIIRTEMEKLPMTGDAAKLKPLADSARNAARAQFQALDADPAYKAAVNETVSPDRFVNRFIINGNRDDVGLMRQNLAHDPAAQQTMSVAALDHLRNSARIDDQFRGAFTQAGYNKSLQSLDTKLSTLFGPKDAGDIRALGNVARNQQFRPPGSYVNESNTYTAAVADSASSNVRKTLETAADIKTHGLYSTVAKPFFKARAAKKLAEEHLSVGAGLDYPSTP